MRFARSVALSLVTLAAVTTLPAPPALAGGTVFEFDHRYLVAGEVVTGHATFSLHGTGSGKLRDGPYFAYLMPGGNGIRAPRIPATAIPLGLVRMDRLESPWLVRATVRFRVPDVPRGVHSVALCNSPCRDTVVGDLMGAWISVVGSPEEARLRTRLDRSAAARTRIDRRIDALLRAVQRQHGDDLVRTTAILTQLRQRAASLATPPAAAEAPARPPRPAPPAGRSTLDRLGWPVAGAFALVSLVLLASKRRRGPEIPRLPDGSVHPDFTRVRRRVRTPSR